jgi:hypothetical protein
MVLLRNSGVIGPCGCAARAASVSNLLARRSSWRGAPPTKLQIDDLDAELIANSLIHIETKRRNGGSSEVAGEHARFKRS